MNIEKCKEYEEKFYFLADLLGWGYLDIDHLFEWIKRAEKLGITIDNLIQDMEDLGGREENINDWFFVIIDRIFYTLIDDLEDRYTDDEEFLIKLEKCKDNFDPFINYLDSWFNNCFDELDFNQDYENILKQAYELIKNK